MKEDRFSGIGKKRVFRDPYDSLTVSANLDFVSSASGGVSPTCKRDGG